PGPVARHTHIDYLTTYNSPAAGVHLRDLVSNQDVFDASGMLSAKTQYGYDESAVASEPGIVQSIPVGSQRGNLTHISRWRSTDGAWLTVTNSYDVAGNVLSTRNPRSYTTSYTYTDCAGTYAFVTTVNKPVPGHTLTLNHDCSSGQVTSIIDPAG